MKNIVRKGVLGTNVAQMEGMMKDERPAMSFKKLKDLVYPALGGYDKGKIFTRRNTPMGITSFKQLASLSSRWCIHDVTAHTTIRVCPNAYYKMHPVADQNPSLFFRYNYLLNILPVFMFNRGGFRVMAYNCSNYPADGQYFEQTPAVTGTVDMEYRTDQPFMVQSLASPITFLSPIVDEEVYNISSGLNIVQGNEKMPFDVVIPHYDVDNCRVTNYLTTPQATAQIQQSAYQFLYIVHPSPQATGRSRLMVLLSAADDFIMGCQIGIPASFTILEAESLIEQKPEGFVETNNAPALDPNNSTVESLPRNRRDISDELVSSDDDSLYTKFWKKSHK